MANDWIAVADQPPPRGEPVVYARPNPRRPGNWHVGIAYWTVSQKWNPQAESQHAPEGFTHWKPLGEQPRARGVGEGRHQTNPPKDPQLHRPIPTVKLPQPPDYPEPGPRGYMREQALQRLARLAEIQRPRPPYPTPTCRLHSLHTAPAARAFNSLVRAQQRRKGW